MGCAVRYGIRGLDLFEGSFDGDWVGQAFTGYSDISLRFMRMLMIGVGHDAVAPIHEGSFGQ